MVDGQGCDFEAQGIGVGFVLMFEREVTSARELGAGEMDGRCYGRGK